MATFDYDLFVIGAGSGGVRAARVSAAHGAKVAIAEEYRLGGTCVIRGCVPKKLFVYASHFSESFEDARGFGWDQGRPAFDWPALRANKDKEIGRLEGIYGKLLDGSGVEICRSRAVFQDAHTIMLEAENRTITAKTILIATGAWPFIPEIEGREHAITSNEAFDLETLPDSIAIVGGGYIAVEFAGIFHGLGVKTTLLYRGPKILRGFDADLQDGLMAEMAKKNLTVMTETNIKAIAKSKSGFTVTLDNGEALQTGLVMYATGRRPNTLGLGLDRADVHLTEHGAIAVDGLSRTNVENIYAIGDVTDRLNLTPVAIADGIAFAETVFNNNPTPVDHETVATAVFSQPEIGTVGLTEAQAREKYGRIDIYKSGFRPLKHTLSGRDENMMMKLIVDADSDRVLGCHILGEAAGEMAQCLGIAVKMGATKADFDCTMAVHPTAAEELVTMRDKWLPD
jgi:glutathione reductase (NADPH)